MKGLRLVIEKRSGVPIDFWIYREATIRKGQENSQVQLEGYYGEDMYDQQRPPEWHVNVEVKSSFFESAKPTEQAAYEAVLASEGQPEWQTAEVVE
jgi:hypothetical protein